MLLSTGAERFLNGAPDLHGVDCAFAAPRTKGRHSGRPGQVIEEIATLAVDRPNSAFVSTPGADRDLVLNPLRVWRKDQLRDEDRSRGTRSNLTRALAMQPTVDSNQELAVLLKRFLPRSDVLGRHSRSPGLSRRWASRARSARELAPYRRSISLERHPAISCRSPSVPSDASQR
jgi:hypothetical protein